jgi:glycosyltransferase involved in cell wall biosynthesis
MSRRLRIVHVCPFFFPVPGGLENVILHLGRGMATRGHEVTVFTSDRSRSGRVADDAPQEIDGIRVRRFRNWLRLGSFASLWPGFCRELRRLDCDIVHAHSYRHPHCELASLRVVRRDARFVLQPHWPGHPRAGLARHLTRPYDATLGRRLLRRCDLVLALTPEEAAWLRARGAERVRILPNGIPERLLGMPNGTEFRTRHGIRGFFLLSVGRIDDMKGFQFVVHALRAVPGVVYGVAGPPGDGYERLVRLAREEGVADRVRFFGELSEEDVVRALDASDAFIQPSVFEAFGLSALEAVARGRACAVSRAVAVRSLLDGCALLFEPGNVEEIAACLTRLRDDTVLRTRLGAAGRERAARYTWERIIPCYEQALLELVAAPRRQWHSLPAAPG